jgi:outer membrane lipoprotein carrier protein
MNPHRLRQTIMKRYIRPLLIAFLALLAGTGAYSSVQAQSANQVFERVRDTYKSVQSVQAEFTQTMTSDYSDETQRASGTVYLQGEKYRVETPNQTMVTDGKVTWVYVPADKQVLVNAYVRDETTFTLNDFFFREAGRYTATKVTTTQSGGQKHFVLTLKPKDEESFFTEVTLTLRDRDAVITRLQVADVNGTTMDFMLNNIQLNPKLAGTVFTFTPPQNVEVVDLRS